MSKKPCKECPWINDNVHSLKFRSYFDKMKSIGVKKHACHMTTLDIWGYENKIYIDSLCRGQNLNCKDEKSN